MAQATNVAKVNVGRNLETGYILGGLVLLLATTGLLLSPTVSARLHLLEAGLGNALYVTHLSLAILLVVFILWHLWPYAYAFTKKAGHSWLAHVASWVLLAVAIFQIYTGYVLWFRDYAIFEKPTAVKVHLYTAFVLLVPLGIHAIRGVQLTLARRGAVEQMLAAAEAHDTLPQALETRRTVTRRVFVRLSAYTVAAVALALSLGRAVTEQIMAWRLNFVGETPIITKEAWRLRVTGLVNRPIEMTYNDLVGLTVIKKKFTHHCVEGWSYTDEFIGVPLREVLERAGGTRSGATTLIFKSAETSNRRSTFGQRYTTNFPLADGLSDDVLLVFGVGREDLPALHGGPVRLMSPIKWGYKACKWLNEIEVGSNAAYRGYWEQFGYHNDGDYPGPIFD